MDVSSILCAIENDHVLKSEKIVLERNQAAALQFQWRWATCSCSCKQGFDIECDLKTSSIEHLEYEEEEWEIAVYRGLGVGALYEMDSCWYCMYGVPVLEWHKPLAFVYE